MAWVHLTRHGRGLVLSAQPERLLSGLAVVVQFLPGVGTALPSPARESSRELLFGVVDKRSIGYLLLLFGGRGATYALASCLRMHTWLWEDSR